MNSGYSKFKDENKNIISVVEIDDISRYGKLKWIKKYYYEFFWKENKLENGIINSGFYKLNSSIFKDYNAKNFQLKMILQPFKEMKLYGKKLIQIL